MKRRPVVGWFRDYLHWIRTSPNGIDESNATNNHGTCWALQEAAFAHLVGDEAALADARRRFTEILLPGQMAPDGSFPQELRRTKSYGYSIFDLDVMSGLAVVLSTPQDDMMKFTLPDGRNLLKGVTFLAPYLADKSLWTKEVRRPASSQARIRDQRRSPGAARCNVLERLAGAPAVVNLRSALRRPFGLARDLEEARSRSDRGRNPPQPADSPTGALGALMGRRSRAFRDGVCGRRPRST